MRAAKIMVAKHYKKHKKEAMYWISVLFNCSTFDELENVIESLVIILNCENTSILVKKHFERLRQKQLQLCLPPSDDEGFEDVEVFEHDDFSYATVATDQKQELNSKFFIYFNQQLHNFVSSQASSAHQKQAAEEDKHSDVYFNPRFCEIILRYLVSRICTTSRLLQGNLSRHCIKDSDNEKTYRDYSNIFKNLASKKIKTICSNNRTRRIIEQYFFILKTIFFKGKRLTSLDEFVEKFHLELMTSQRLFADSALHNGNKKFHSITDKNSDEKKCRVVESKFREEKKRRSSGYYSSSNAQKRNKFIGNLPEKDKSDKTTNCLPNYINSLNQDVFDQSNSITNFTAPLVLSAFSNLDEKNLNIMKTFATTLWSLLPNAERNLKDYAIFFNGEYKMTWVDFLALNPSPSPSQSDAMKALNDTSGKGWLSKNVIDCYLAVIVNKANIEEGSEKIGSLSYDDFAMIQQDSI